jgi:hypothetical protein
LSPLGGILAGPVLGLLAQLLLLLAHARLELLLGAAIGLLAGPLGRLGHLALEVRGLLLQPRLRLGAGTVLGLAGEPLDQ